MFDMGFLAHRSKFSGLHWNGEFPAAEVDDCLAAVVAPFFFFFGLWWWEGEGGGGYWFLLFYVYF